MMKLNYVVGLILIILIMLVAFQNGSKMVQLRLLQWGWRISQGLVIIGSTVFGILLGSIIRFR